MKIKRYMLLLIFTFLGVFLFLKIYTNEIFRIANREMYLDLEVNDSNNKVRDYDNLILKFNKSYYDSLSMNYENNLNKEDFLNLSIQVSNKWKYGTASYYVFRVISNTKNQKNLNCPDLSFLDKNTKIFCIKYLIKSKNEGDIINSKIIYDNYMKEKEYRNLILEIEKNIEFK